MLCLSHWQRRKISEKQEPTIQRNKRINMISLKMVAENNKFWSTSWMNNLIHEIPNKCQNVSKTKSFRNVENFIHLWIVVVAVTSQNWDCSHLEFNWKTSTDTIRLAWCQTTQFQTYAVLNKVTQLYIYTHIYIYN